jgi:hypothetical protein
VQTGGTDLLFCNLVWRKTMNTKSTIGALLVMLATTLVSTGCGGGGNGKAEDALFQPAVTLTSPSSGALAVPTNYQSPGTSVITATFNKPMEPSSITAQTFFAISNSGELPGVVTYSNQVATLTLTSALPPNSPITVKLSGFSAQAGQGHPTLGLSYSWSFQTAGNVQSSGVVSKL